MQEIDQSLTVIDKAFDSYASMEDIVQLIKGKELDDVSRECACSSAEQILQDLYEDDISVEVTVRNDIIIKGHKVGSVTSLVPTPTVKSVLVRIIQGIRNAIKKLFNKAKVALVHLFNSGGDYTGVAVALYNQLTNPEMKSHMSAEPTEPTVVYHVAQSKFTKKRGPSVQLDDVVRLQQMYLKISSILTKSVDALTIGNGIGIARKVPGQLISMLDLTRDKDTEFRRHYVSQVFANKVIHMEYDPDFGTREDRNDYLTIKLEGTPAVKYTPRILSVKESTNILKTVSKIDFSKGRTINKDMAKLTGKLDSILNNLLVRLRMRDGQDHTNVTVKQINAISKGITNILSLISIRTYLLLIEIVKYSMLCATESVKSYTEKKRWGALTGKARKVVGDGRMGKLLDRLT